MTNSEQLSNKVENILHVVKMKSIIPREVMRPQPGHDDEGPLFVHQLLQDRMQLVFSSQMQLQSIHERDEALHIIELRKAIHE